MYDKLVKSLRICGDSVDAIDECCYEDCIFHERPINPLCMQVLCNKAAAAIEELQAQNNELLFRCGQAEALIDYYQTGKLPSNEPPKEEE